MSSLGKRRVYVALALLLLLSISFLQAQDHRAGCTAEVLQAELAFQEALLSGDPDRVASLIAHDLAFTHSSGHLWTKQQMLEAMRTTWKMELLATKGERTVQFHGEDLAVLTGDIHGKTNSRNHARDLVQSLVFVRSGGVWRVALWHLGTKQ